MITHLHDAKVGDKLVTTNGWSRCIITVERVTSTQVIAAGQRFHKKYGKLVGSHTFNAIRARLVTPEDFVSIRIDVAQRKLRDFTVKAENLEAVEALLK